MRDKVIVDEDGVLGHSGRDELPISIPKLFVPEVLMWVHGPQINWHYGL